MFAYEKIIEEFLNKIESKYSIKKDEVITLFKSNSKFSAQKALPVKEIIKPLLPEDIKNNILKRLEKLREEIVIVKNSNGIYEHPSTHFVFSIETHGVIGKYVNSEVKNLTVEDIELCKTYNFKYEVPLNLLGENPNYKDLEVMCQNKEKLADDTSMDMSDEEVNDEV